MKPPQGGVLLLLLKISIYVTWSWLFHNVQSNTPRTKRVCKLVTTRLRHSLVRNMKIYDKLRSSYLGTTTQRTDHSDSERHHSGVSRKPLSINPEERPYQEQHVLLLLNIDLDGVWQVATPENLYWANWWNNHRWLIQLSCNIYSTFLTTQQH